MQGKVLCRVITINCCANVNAHLIVRKLREYVQVLVLLNEIEWEENRISILISNQFVTNKFNKLRLFFMSFMCSRYLMVGVFEFVKWKQIFYTHFLPLNVRNKSGESFPLLSVTSRPHPISPQHNSLKLEVRHRPRLIIAHSPAPRNTHTRTLIGKQSTSTTQAIRCSPLIRFVWNPISATRCPSDEADGGLGGCAVMVSLSCITWM